LVLDLKVNLNKIFLLENINFTILQNMIVENLKNTLILDLSNGENFIFENIEILNSINVLLIN
jgi:hypothetical protein